MSEAEAYGRVIDLIAEEAIDWRRIGLALAKANPSAFLVIHDTILAAPHSSEGRQVQMDQLCLELTREGRHVEAIKHCRAVTGWGLKEAKDHCDALRDGKIKPVAAATAVSPTELNRKLAELLGDPTSPRAAKYPDEGDYA